jgi:hypothetical protein
MINFGLCEPGITKNKTMKNTLIALFLLFFYSCSFNHTRIIESPDGNIQLGVSDKNNLLEFFLIYKDDTIIGKSPIGLELNGINFSEEIRMTNMSVTKFDETWNTINGKNPKVRNQYSEFVFSVENKKLSTLTYQISIRCYNDGVAYRYEIDNTSHDPVSISKELTKLKFRTDYTWWSYNGENHNIGPLKASETAGKIIRTPMVLKLNDSQYMAIHEAEIINHAGYNLIRAENNKDICFALPELESAKVFLSSWRSLIIGDKPGDLLESNLIVNLNKPCKIEDTSWIKPGKAMWDWRVWGYQAADGFEYGLNTESHKRFIDFASENNIQYLLIDADWYGSEFSESSDPTSARKEVDIIECMRFARDRNVGVILYLNDVGAKKFGLERVLKQFSEWGAVGVKYGFMRGTAHEKVKHTREVVELCAKYKLMVNFHDNPVAPSGDRRTWPNLMTKEFGHSQADAKRSYYPETAVTSPFVNMIAGPLDMCEGWFDFNTSLSRVKVFEEIPGTVAAEVAKLIVNYSGWKILPDSPEEYLKKDDLFDCIRKMPAQFDSFKVLDGQIGELISVARRSEEDWFVGSLSNRESRTLTIDFGFLPAQTEFKATFYSDKKNTHFLDNREAYQIHEQDINSDSKIEIFLAPGGGQAIYIEKK